MRNTELMVLNIFIENLRLTKKKTFVKEYPEMYEQNK